MDNRKKPDQPAEEGRNPRYHVYVRLPFNRGDFVDPGTVSRTVQSDKTSLTISSKVNWDEKKSEALWSILSDSSLADVDCQYFPPYPTASLLTIQTGTKL